MGFESSCSQLQANILIPLAKEQSNQIVCLSLHFKKSNVARSLQTALLYKKNKIIIKKNCSTFALSECCSSAVFLSHFWWQFVSNFAFLIASQRIPFTWLFCGSSYKVAHLPCFVQWHLILALSPQESCIINFSKRWYCDKIVVLPCYT